MDLIPENLTAEVKSQIDAFCKGLDKVSFSIAAFMFNDGLSFETIRRLLPIAELACRDKDPAGGLVFTEINMPFPQVQYYPDAGSIKFLLLKNNRTQYVLRLLPMLELGMGPTSGPTQ